MRKRDSVVVALDIGTTKVCALAAEITRENRIKLLGTGTSPSHGLKKGVVINIEETVDSIKNAIREAGKTAGIEIKGVYTGIAGSHISGINSRGVVPIKNQEVTINDIEKAIETARAVTIPPDKEILHVIPQEFIVDGQNGIKNPLGISGVRLEVQVHIITGGITSVQNIVKSINKAGLEVMDIMLQPLASSEAVLTQDEKDLGVVMIDIGGGTTDLAIFTNGAIAHTAVIPVGGNHVTNDIAIGLSTPASEAEKIKIQYGCAMRSLLNGNSAIEVASVGGRPPHQVSQHTIAEIIELRADEIFRLVLNEIKKVQHVSTISSGIVITGGTSSLNGITDVAEKITGMPVRRGVPLSIEGLSDTFRHPMYATGIGILNSAILQGMEDKRLIDGTMFENIFYRMRNWFGGFFNF